jgi:hypothetical protein
LATQYKAASALVQGNMGQAFEEVVPIGFKNAVKLYRDDWKILDNEGRLLLEPTQAELAMRAIGFAPGRLSAAYKANRLEARSKGIEARRRKHFRSDVADLFSEGQMGEAQRRITQASLTDPTFDRNYEIRQITQMLIQREFPKQAQGLYGSLNDVLGVAPADTSQLLQRHSRANQIQLGLGGPQRRKYREAFPQEAQELTPGVLEMF